MSEATLRSATGAYIAITSLDNDSRPSTSASQRLPSAILHTIPPEDEPAHPAPEEEQSTTVIRPPFSPFYTLINDAGNSSAHHPVNVQYIFADDDTDILTTACLQAIPGSSSQSSSGLMARSASSSMASPSKEQAQTLTSRPSSKSGPTNSQSQTREPERRTILIDLDETGTHITSAQSLTSSWQVMSTNLSPAPTWEEEPSGKGGAATARFMLSIEGLNGIKQQASIQQGKEVTGEDFKALREEFEKRMSMLRTVVEAGDRRLGVDRESENADDEGEDAGQRNGHGKESQDIKE